MSDPRDPTDDEPEIMDAGPPDEEGEQLPDGSTIETIADEQPAEPADDQFYANLAEIIPQDMLGSISQELLIKIEVDKKSREKRDEQYEEGLRRTGLGKDAPGGADFQGASRAVHPLFVEACIDFSSRVIKELMPPDGQIVKDKIIGEITPDKTEKAKRKAAHFNYQLTEEIKETRPVFEQMLTQVPLGGSQYIKAYFNSSTERIALEFVAIDNVFLPYLADGWRAAKRKTHRLYLDAQTIQERMDSEMYRQLDLPPTAAVTSDMSKSEQANQKIQGEQDPGDNKDGTREIYETCFMMTVNETWAPHLKYEEEGSIYPYIITIDVQTQEVLALYRNWDEDDPTHEEMTHMEEFLFIPWRGAYGVGLPHLIGGLSAAATGALRALLDSAHINNVVTLLRLDNKGISGQQTITRPGDTSDVKAPLNVTDIRMAAQPVTFNPPSPVLFALLEFIVREGKGVVRTSLDETPADTAANVPVGTQLSRVEQGLVVYSSVFGRMHRSFQNLLRIMHRINRKHLPEQVTVDAGGQEVLVYRADYEGPMDVVPVSDPHIFSEQQRFAQLTAVSQRAATMPQFYNLRKVEERFLQGMKIPNWQELLVPMPEPQRMNQVAENVAMALGRPAVAFPDQDHLSHIQVLLDFLTSPVLGESAIIAPKFISAALEHLKEHVVFWYLGQFHQLVTQAAGMDAGDLMSPDPQEQQEADKVLAMASPLIAKQATQAFQSQPQLIQQAMKILQQYAPPTPTDPSQGALAVAQIEASVQTQANQQRAAQGQGELQVKAQKMKQDFALAMKRIQQEFDLAIAEMGSREAIAADKTQTAKETAAVDALEGRRAALTDAGGIR